MLALLLVNANQPVSADLLIDGLWEERPPTNVAKTVQIYISRLRRPAWPRPNSVPPPPATCCGSNRKSSTRVVRAACGRGPEPFEAGNPARAEIVLSEALDLWRGEALADFRFNGFAQAEIDRLQERHASVVADRIDARLALGRGEQVIPELEALIREQPLSERPRRQLMLALYHAGRQADALEAYQAARSALVEELGIEPGRRLRELHQQILSQDPALDLAANLTSVPRRRLPRLLDPNLVELHLTREARKTITAVFVGITLSSGLGEPLDPETLRHVAGRALSEGHAAAERHGGSIETVAGDALTFVFGLPTVHEDDALRAVRAAAELRAALVGLAERVRSRALHPARPSASGSAPARWSPAAIPRPMGAPPGSR